MPHLSYRLSRGIRPLALIMLLVVACAVSSPAASTGAMARTPAEALAGARRLEHSGEWEAAARSYTEALAGEGEAGLEARFELARLLHRLGNNGSAAGLLTDLARGGASPSVVRAAFVQGSVQGDLGEHTAAAAAYARYAELGGAAAAYARVEQGRELSFADREAALAALRPVTGGSGPALARRRALQLAAGLEEAAERPDRALAHVRAVLDLGPSFAERVLVMARIGALQRQTGDIDAAAETYRALAAGYPTTPEAETALERLGEIGRPVDPLVAGIVYYRHRANEMARDLFNGYLRANGATGEGAATALFYLGALAERRDDTGMALENYGQSHDAAPTGPLAVEALWERASVLEGAERRDEAITAYALVAERFPTSRRAADASFRSGYLAYIAGQKARARTTWSAAAASTDSAAAARASFWAGRAAAEVGDGAAAREAYAEAARRDPAGYHGLRAAALLVGEPAAPALSRALLPTPPLDWVAADGWLAGWAGPEDAGAWQTAADSEEWRAAVELLALGWRRTGREAVTAVLDAHARQPWVLYRMARTLDAAGYPHLAYAAAGRLVAAAPVSAAPAAPAILRLVYPAPWPNEVNYYAMQYGADPAMVYAMMRQESAFDPEAGSSAGAFGLTQVIPGTAREIARALGKAPFEFGDLARPNIAIQFGAYYLGGQLRNFDANPYHALAAYNGGGGNASRWIRAAGGPDIDRFYEEVDFGETKLYLRLVLQNYAWYRHLYGGATRPALTR